MTIWRGAPSAPFVESTAQRGALRNARTGSIRARPSVMRREGYRRARQTTGRGGRRCGTLGTALSLPGFVGRWYRRSRRSRLVLAPTLVALTVLAVPIGSATGGVAVQPHRALNGERLSAAERSAVTI